MSKVSGLLFLKKYISHSNKATSRGQYLEDMISQIQKTEDSFYEDKDFSKDKIENNENRLYRDIF